MIDPSHLLPQRVYAVLSPWHPARAAIIWALLVSTADAADSWRLSQFMQHP